MNARPAAMPSNCPFCGAMFDTIIIDKMPDPRNRQTEDVSTMTPKQLERKVKQLHSRKRLVQTLEELEEAIKTFMTLEGKLEIQTENFTLRLVEGALDIALRSQTCLNQLTLDFIKSKQKEELRNESIYSEETPA